MKVTIDKSRCTKCGICAQICPNRIPEKLETGEIRVRSDREHVCISCGHCMMYCKSEAITAGSLRYDKDFQKLPPENGNQLGFSDFIAERHSVRNFSEKEVPKKNNRKDNHRHKPFTNGISSVVLFDYSHKRQSTD